jgi:hypothetical protein
MNFLYCFYYNENEIWGEKKKVWWVKTKGVFGFVRWPTSYLVTFHF